MIDTEHGFFVGINLQGEDQFFHCFSSQPDRPIRKKRVEYIYRDNCVAAGVDCWSPLGLLFAKDAANGRFPVPYTPCEIARQSDEPHLEYAEMYNAERYRFPAANLFPAERELYNRGVVALRDKQVASVVERVKSELRMDGLLMEAQEVAILAQKPLVDEGTQTLTYAGKSVRFRGAIQFRLLQRLAMDAGRFVDNVELGEFVWGDDDIKDKLISNTRGHIERKLAAANITGVGFDAVSGRTRMILS
ncbi:response regulator transcription factor [Rubinisphaera italica]|uniref:Uncharacterized protein n=1 Tax=Rubinisphaera italica TaxID=2527969 RepID=A0A5C5XMM9_9PLAN|nr:response regulator transcription factor [Rubinisphaera italica]TWT64417.1 hypothetical protein Pan54_51790 [Rubinisphaera italica]